jgi:putative ABC transport system permease protein
MGWSSEEAIGKPLIYGGRNGNIIGVIKDFHFESLHNKIVPIILLINKSGHGQISVKISGKNTPATLDFLKGKWEEFRPEYPFDYSFLDEDYSALYKSEQQLGLIFGLFSSLAVVIACLGLFGLASFSAIQRTKEIGIRKILGASVSGIIALFSKDFLKLIFIANFIAWPLAYYAMSRWLENFAYRTEISAATFIIAGLTAVVIALATISYQSVKTALANPVKSLRHE